MQLTTTFIGDQLTVGDQIGWSHAYQIKLQWANVAGFTQYFTD